MLQSYIVYVLLCLWMILCGLWASYRERCTPTYGYHKLSFLYPEVLLLLFPFAIIFGCRYNVGVDYPHYLEDYLWGADRDFEPIFAWVNDNMSSLGIHYAYFFSLWAFIQVFFIFYTFKNQRYLFPYIAFFLIIGSYYLSMMNIIRQQLAACIFLYSLRYVDQKKVLKYYLLVLLAMMFHKSAILLIIAYPILRWKSDWFPKIKFQFILLFIAVYLSTNYDLVVKLISRPFALFTGFLGYENYLEGILYNEKLNSANQFGNNTGLGIYIYIYMAIVVICFSQKLKSYYNSSFFNMIYSLWFIRVLADFIVGDSIILNRPFVYFYDIKMILLAHFMYYCVKSRKALPQLLALSFFFLHVIMFINMLSNGDVNTTKFMFFWQK